MKEEGFDRTYESHIKNEREKQMSDLLEYDISTEAWREYDWPARAMMPYRINDPQKLFIRPGGTTHRVVDKDGIVHCVPSVGANGCVLRWQNFNTDKPVNF